MPENVVKYEAKDAIATITLNRPDKFNTLRPDVLNALEAAMAEANRAEDIKVIILEGAGDSFCGGFDFSDGLEHFEEVQEEGYDPGRDVDLVTSRYKSYMTTFMGLWRGSKPVIAKVHGYCLGGGSELALCRTGRGVRRCSFWHTLFSIVGLSPDRHVGLPAGPCQGQVLRADR